METFLILFSVGTFSGVLAGFLGIGGGVILFPILVWLGTLPKQAAATSLLAIALTSSSGTFQNWRMGYIRPRQVLMLGIPSMISVKFGADIGQSISSSALLIGFGILLVTNIFLFEFRKWVIKRQRKIEAQVDTTQPVREDRNTNLSKLYPVLIGSIAGLLAGLFGVGGGVILVPLQIFLLRESIKRAIQTSLAVILLTSISGCIAHGLNGNILPVQGLMLGIGGILGAQFSTRFLPSMSDKSVTLAFRILLIALSIYSFSRAISI